MKRDQIRKLIAGHNISATNYLPMDILHFTFPFLYKSKQVDLDLLYFMMTHENLQVSLPCSRLKSSK